MSDIQLTADDGVGVLTLSAPDRRNALDRTMSLDIAEAVEEAERREDISALVITGAPPAFCAGAVLSELGTATEEDLQQIYSGFMAVSETFLPTIAAVNGPAVGAGMNMALVCDIRLAGRSALFDSRFLDLAIHPGGGHTWMLQRIVGPQTAAAMVLFGETLDGEEAARRGLAWRCVEDADLLDEAVALAGRTTNVPAMLMRRTSRTLAEIGQMEDHFAAVEMELVAQLWSIGRPDFIERINRAMGSD